VCSGPKRSSKMERRRGSPVGSARGSNGSGRSAVSDGRDLWRDKRHDLANRYRSSRTDGPCVPLLPCFQYRDLASASYPDCFLPQSTGNG
jgi:hypothetical protein